MKARLRAEGEGQTEAPLLRVSVGLWILWSVVLQSKNEKPLETVAFNENSVMAVISKLKVNLSAGLDGLPPILFKELKHSR